MSKKHPGTGDDTTTELSFSMPPTRDIYGEILAAGAVVGSYVVDELASEGGFAAVYRARHLDTGAPAALKVLRRALAASPRMLERFHLEAETVRRLRHPNIVDIYELDQLPMGRPYIAMEWLEGRNLHEELAVRGPFTAPEALAIMEEVGGALACAHDAGVVHRDVKDRNIMLVPAGPTGSGFTVKLVDFGIAKLTAPDDQHLALTTRTFIGTPNTMAPEQLRRQTVDARTDIYALGLVLYELVCGRLPFASESYAVIEQMHLHMSPPRPSESARVSAAFDEVVLRALQKDREDRYPSVTELLEELRRAVGGASAPAAVTADPGVGREVSCVGVCIEVKAAGDASEDEGELLDAIDDHIDDILDGAHELIEARGLQVILSTASSILAVALPDATRSRDQRREELIQAVLSWYRARAEEAPPTVEIHVTLHEAGATVAEGGEQHARAQSQARLVGGDLLHLDRWPRRPEVAGVLASRAALADLHISNPDQPELRPAAKRQRYRAYPLAESADFCRIEDVKRLATAPTVIS